MKDWKTAILGKSTAGRIAMALFALLVLVVLASVAFGGFESIEDKRTVSRGEYHKFVQDAKALYGDNRSEWPQRVEHQRWLLFRLYMQGRKWA